jgi:hypothetical protein
MNCLVDTIAANILAAEVPASKEISNFEDSNYVSILDQTSPFDIDSSKNKIFTTSMKLNVLSASIYMQSVLFYIYYNGRLYWADNDNPVDSGPDQWHHVKYYEEQIDDKDSQLIATKIRQDLTFIYQCFYMMCCFNMFSCTITYEDINFGLYFQYQHI